jgi:predicted nucleic acid-binding protein
VILDASAVVDWLIDSPGLGRSISVHLAESTVLATCDLCDVEVTSALRRKVFRGELTAQRALAALEDLTNLNARRFPSGQLTGRIWELRDNLTPFDAAYVALAEALDLPLLTTDARIALAPGHNARVIVAGR